MNEKIQEALKKTSSGDQSALNKVFDVISDNLHAAVIMLKVGSGLITSLLIKLTSDVKINCDVVGN